jgi:hypothetical protein
MKNRATKSVAQISVAPNKFCNLSSSKKGKNWHFIFSKVDTLKQKIFATENTQK